MLAALVIVHCYFFIADCVQPRPETLHLLYTIIFLNILDTVQGAPQAVQVGQAPADAGGEIIIQTDVHVQPHKLDDFHKGMSK